METFLMAERIGDWKLHLQCVQKMIPYFHATGYFPYANSCHIYLSDMKNLKSKLNEDVYQQFVNEGFLLLDGLTNFSQVFEQTLMRSMKTSGGLTHGRGITDSVLHKWIRCTPATYNVCESIEKFSGVYLTTSAQHIDMRKCRIVRDDKDTNNLYE